MASQLKAQVDKLLTNVSNAYIPEGYISEEALPELSVKQKTGRIGKYGQNHLRVVNTLMAGRGKAPRFDPIRREVDDKYGVESHGLEGMVTEDDYDNVEEPFDAESDETIGLTNVIWLGKEQALASTLTDASVITQGVTLSTASDKFSDYENSKPLEVFREAQNKVLDGCGMNPNRAIISQKVFNTLKYHPSILRTLGYADNRAGTLTIQEVAKAMNVDILHVGRVSYNPNNIGQEGSLQQLWGVDIVFYYAPRQAAKYQQSLGYYVRMTRGKRRVFKYALDNPPESKGILVDDHYSFELTNPNCAYLISDSIAVS